MTTSALGELVVGNILTTAALRFGDSEAFYCTATGRRTGFAELNDRCNRLVHALQSQGIRQGDCVAFLSSNRLEIVEIYFALAKGGYVGMPLNYRLHSAEMHSLLQDVDACALLFEEKFAAAAQAACADLPALRTHIVLGESGAHEYALAYEDLLARSSPAEPQVTVHEHDPYYYNLTSGTTGVPKCYAISHYASATLFTMAHALDMSRRDTVLTAIPMYGRIGFFWMLASVLFGARNVLMNFAPDEVLAAIEHEGVTITNLVPTMGAMLLASPKLAGARLGSLRGLVFAGSLLPTSVREGVKAQLCPHLYEYYGMQESAALVVSTPEDRKLRPDSVGRPILFSEVRIVDEKGHDVASGETGSIIGRSTGSVTSYHRNPAKTAETFINGWLHTGDLGRMDPQGFLFISGRLKDLIVTGGQNVHAGEVEEAIFGMPGIFDCAVIGLTDPLWGEAVTAVVIPQAGAEVDAEAVIAHCRQTLAGFKAPKRVIAQTDPLPRTPTGKVQKFLLTQRYQG